MSDTPSNEDLLKLLKRERFVREQLNNRLASLLGENLELLAIVQELQEALKESQEEPHPEVLADVTS